MVFMHSFGSHEELVDAYRAWARIPPERFKERDIAWNNYVAIRDGRANDFSNAPKKEEPEGAATRRRLVQ